MRAGVKAWKAQSTQRRHRRGVQAPQTHSALFYHYIIARGEQELYCEHIPRYVLVSAVELCAKDQRDCRSALSEKIVRDLAYTYFLFFFSFLFNAEGSPRGCLRGQLEKKVFEMQSRRGLIRCRLTFNLVRVD